MSDSKLRTIICVLGEDKPGIVAAVASCLADHQANIVDISQAVMGSLFTMTMVIDLAHDEDFKPISEDLEKLANTLGLQISFQREDIFKFMYRV